MHPGALTCFAVAECRGWRWGRVHGEGSAGSVLRSQGSSGEDGAFARRARERFDRFLCSLRPDPAAASWRRRKAPARSRSRSRSRCRCRWRWEYGVRGSWGSAERVFPEARVFRLLPCASFVLGAFRLPSRPVWEPSEGDSGIAKRSRHRDHLGCERFHPPAVAGPEPSQGALPDLGPLRHRE